MMLAACGPSGGGPGGPGQAAGNSVVALTVDVTQPSVRQLAGELETSGTVYAWQEVAVGAEVSGYRLSEVLVDVGDRVAKDQVLARLDDTLLKEALRQAEATVAEYRATLDQARAQAKRGNALRETGLMSAQDVETLNTSVTTSATRLNSAESQLETAKQRLLYATVRAPDSGVISERDATPGQIPIAGATLFKLIRQSRVEWRADIPAGDLTKVKRGMKASITRADGSVVSGAVRTVSPGLDPNTQRGTAYVDFQLDSLVRPGMYVTGRLELGKAQTVTVPLAAVSVRDGFNYVFVLEEGNKLRQQRVQVGRLLTDAMEITGGLERDATIVASGTSFVRDGDVVQIAQATAQSVASSSQSSTPSVVQSPASSATAARK